MFAKFKDLNFNLHKEIFNPFEIVVFVIEVS